MLMFTPNKIYRLFNYLSAFFSIPKRCCGDERDTCPQRTSWRGYIIENSLRTAATQHDGGRAEPGCGWVVSTNGQIWWAETEEDLAHTFIGWTPHPTPCLGHVPKLTHRATVPLTPNLDSWRKTKTNFNFVPKGQFKRTHFSSLRDTINKHKQHAYCTITCVTYTFHRHTAQSHSTHRTSSFNT